MSSSRKSVTITLNPGEVNVCKAHVKQRLEQKKIDMAAGKITEKKVGKQDPVKAELDAFGAEMAVARYLNLYPDFSVTKKKGTPDLYAVYEGRIMGIDVKQTVYPDGNLLAPKWKKLEHADLYVLVTGEMPVYVVVGWVWNTELIQKDNLRGYGYGAKGLCYSLAQKVLREFKDVTEVDRDV